MSSKLSKASISVLCLSIVALVSMTFDFFDDTFFEMLLSEYYTGIERVFTWMHLVSYALINVFNWISKKDSALLFSGFNFLSLIVLFAIQLISYNYPEFNLGFFIMAAISITVLIICYKTKKQHEQG